MFYLLRRLSAHNANSASPIRRKTTWIKMNVWIVMNITGAIHTIWWYIRCINQIDRTGRICMKPTQRSCCSFTDTCCFDWNVIYRAFDRSSRNFYTSNLHPSCRCLFCHVLTIQESWSMFDLFWQKLCVKKPQPRILSTINFSFVPNV